MRPVSSRCLVNVNYFRSILALLAVALSVGPTFGAVPVEVTPVVARHGMVVAGHPQAAAAGVRTLQAGGNAIDAAITVSLALNVAEPYGSGLGGKLMLLYYEATSGRTFVIDAMDASGSVDVAAYLQRPKADRSYGYGSVCVPGLGAGLWLAHQKWGARDWAADVAPAIELARAGTEILPKTRLFYAEQEKKLKQGDAEIARLYLPGGQLPETGTFLANPDLAATLEQFAAHGRDGFYRGRVAEALVHASAEGGGDLTLEDLANYEARLTEPVQLDFRGYQILSAPPPASGPALFLTIMKVLEPDTFAGGPLRTADNLDWIGRVWRHVVPQVQSGIADVPEARFNFEQMIAPESIAALREQALQNTPIAAEQEVALWLDDSFTDNAMAATTHFAVADAAGNIVCATQSLSLHFGAGVVAPGTGVVLNDTMSNFAYFDAGNINYIAPGKRPRSTIAPTMVFRAGRPQFAIGIPGSSRIPTAILQALLDRLVLHRSLADAIGDTRVHLTGGQGWNGEETVEAEQSLPADVVRDLEQRGWKVELPEPANTGRHFGGINVIAINPDGTYTGYADPRRTNAAAGY
ncbi:MAG: gamma-glutamyltransferase family protein [Cephaloticoccus sp.]|nr:gamma-glutamyltransferase family protein [Cephaloticoccus sp.]